jgi:hypothetical protein
MAVKRDIKYINRDFDNFKNRLIDFSKTYFPTSYNDFTPSSPGTMFMEMASYVGDVLSFYLDNQIQETFIQYARQTSNLYELAYLLGYKPKTTAAATVTLDFYQQLPAKAGAPDYDYLLEIDPQAVIKSNANNSVSFITQDKVDFGFSSSLSPTEVVVYQIQGNTPQSFLVKKSVNAISATIASTSFTFEAPQQFSTVSITADNIIGILDIVDSDGNTWYEVSHLAQDTVYDSIKNTNTNDPNYSTDSNVPFLLQTKQVQRRFASRFLNERTLQLQFGAGTSTDTDENITPNPNNVGLGLPFEQDKLTTAYSPTNFVFTNTYGIAPSNTTLTVRYLTGGGVAANVTQNVLTVVSGATIRFKNASLPNDATTQTIFNSVAVTNPVAASGGQDGDSIEEIRQNSLSTFQNQLRTVTTEDYLLRVLSLPPQYGTVSKAFATQAKASDTSENKAAATVNLYVLTYDSDSKLTTASAALKRNIQTYLSQYRVINDSVDIKDAYVINIGVDFEIVTLPNYNSSQVLTDCLNTLKTLFAIDDWQINEPIILRDIFSALDNVDGVQTVKSVNITNKTGESLGYSKYSYDTAGATQNGTVYPSIDPMIFEVKYPDLDIKGRVVSL